MNILQISFHTAPFGSVGKHDSGGLNIYVEKVSKYLSDDHKVTVVTAEKAESFKRYGSAKKLYNFKIDNISNY